MGEEIIISVKDGDRCAFHNNVDYCIGTGRMGLALTEEYQEQLKVVQEEIGFRHIRGHGLFCDDMAIYQEYEEDGVKKAEYNFTYLDRVMDSYVRLGLRPFLELGFMPGKLARGTQTLFYWKANTTPPGDYGGWRRLVQATLEHLIERYGEKEAVCWPVEVWNEPNLPGFWEHADMQEYFKLFHCTYDAVKEVDSRFQVGGPAVCGGSDEKWIRAFLEYCDGHDIMPDFVTRHHYTVEQPERVGHYDYSALMNPEDGFANLRTSRDIIDSFSKFKGLPIHITEFNTSYTPKGVIHDTNLNAALIAQQLSRLGDVNESYSYWTFGDVFEEQGVPFTPFHGGFGLVAEGGICKPVFWTFAFYKRLRESGGECVYRGEHAVVLQRENGDWLGVAWNIAGQGAEQKSVRLSLPAREEEYVLLTRTVDEETCNPLKVWHDIGEPAHLSGARKKLLKEAAAPRLRTERVKAREGVLQAELVLNRNAVVYFEVSACRVISDRGYDYDRAVSEALPGGRA